MSKRMKIKEAGYFLARMKDEKDNRENFEFNLSAFLSAARSVLQYTFEDTKKAKTDEMKWYESSVSGSSIVGYFKDKRDTNIHEERIRPRKDSEITITESAGVKESLSAKIKRADGNVEEKTILDDTETKQKPKKSKTSVVIKSTYRFNDWNGVGDVLNLCESYIKELKKIVQDGVSKGFIKD